MKDHPRVVESLSGCWEWTGAKTRAGYGVFSIRGKLVYAHRYSYEETIGQIPSGLCVCHRCDNRACVNPDHLFLGTIRENAHDAMVKGRVRHGRNHPNAKLDEHGVGEIRSRLVRGENQAAIARSYGVTASNISHIKRGATWART